MMMMMAYSVEGANQMAYQRPRLAGVGAYAPYGYRPEDERQAFVAPLATTVTVGAIGAGGVALWENANAPKRYALNEFDKAVTAELANNPTTTPAKPQNPTSGFNPTQAHEQVMADYLKTLQKDDGKGGQVAALTDKQIEKLSKKGLGEVKEALEKQKLFVEADWKTNFTDKKAYANKLEAAGRQIHYDDGVKKMLAGQVHADGTTPFHSDAKAVEAKLADIADTSKPAITMKSHLEAIRDAKIADFEGELKGTKGSLNNGEQARLAQKTAELNKTMEEQLKAYEKLDDIRTGKDTKFRQQKPGNTPPTQTARTNASTLTEAEARTNVLNETTGQKVTKAKVETLFKDGKVSTPTDAGKLAMENFSKNAIEKGGVVKTKLQPIAIKAGGILAGAAVIGTIAGVVNSGNVQASNKAQLDALRAQEGMASA